MLATANPLHAEIASLRDDLALRDEQLRQLKESFMPKLVFPPAWQLTRAESEILAALYAARGGYLSKEALHMTVAGIEVYTERKIVDVFICKLRRKIKAASIFIETRWGQGYSLPAAARVRIDRALAGEALDPASPKSKWNEAHEEAPMPRTTLPAVYVPPAPGRDLIGELLSLASAEPAHRGVLIRAAAALLDSVPAAQPATIKSARKAPVKAKPTVNGAPAKAAAAAVPPPAAAAAPTVIGDISIDRTPDNESISFRGKTMELSGRQAYLAELLARGKGNPIDRKFLESKLFPTQSAQSAASSLVTLAGVLNEAIAGVGLEAFTVRGVGIVLRPLER